MQSQASTSLSLCNCLCLVTPALLSLQQKYSCICWNKSFFGFFNPFTLSSKFCISLLLDEYIPKLQGSSAKAPQSKNPTRNYILFRAVRKWYSAIHQVGKGIFFFILSVNFCLLKYGGSQVALVTRLLTYPTLSFSQCIVTFLEKGILKQLHWNFSSLCFLMNKIF